MQEENHARSGDNKAICWMTKSVDDFYHEEYRSVPGQCKIISEALDLFGDELRKAVEHPTSKWHRNVRTYLDALKDNALDELTVKDNRPHGPDPVDMGQVLEEMDSIVQQDVFNGDKEAKLSGEGLEQDDDAAPDEGEDESEYVGAGYGARVLCPRHKHFFYGGLLDGLRLWHRPPHNHCERCADYDKAKFRLLELNTALLSEPEDAENAAHEAIVQRAGGSSAAWTESRKLALKLPDLRKHATWFAEARPYVKMREVNMLPNETTLYLDYGGLNDSANKKVSIWGVTVVAPGREQEHFDCFFDQAGKTGVPAQGAAKKDGQTGIFFLGELLDPAKSPINDGKCLFEHHYPACGHIILPGDTGNGYRAYAMLEALSAVFMKYGYTVELSPLAPGHAHNRTDARIAHMNTFLNLLKAKSRVFGAKGVAEAFHTASEHNMRTKRNYLARSHIFYREVTINRQEADALAKKLGSMLVSEDLDKGRMGVRGLLHFDFSVLDIHGATIHTPGYARVREYPDPAKPGNRTRVWTWRKDLAALLCQVCSDALGGPVLLEGSMCTKKTCYVDSQAKAAAAAEAAGNLQPSMPLHGSLASENPPLDKADGQEAGGAQKPARGQKAHKEKKPPQIEHTHESREVRAVYGIEEGGVEMLWFYIPEHRSDKSDTPRKGWWLYSQEDSQGLYYIGPLDTVQSSQQAMITDVACYKDFPFTCTVHVDSITGEHVPGTVRWITDRVLPQELHAADAAKDMRAPPCEEVDELSDQEPGRGNENDDDNQQQQPNAPRKKKRRSAASGDGGDKRRKRRSSRNRR